MEPTLFPAALVSTGNKIRMSSELERTSLTNKNQETLTGLSRAHFSLNTGLAAPQPQPPRPVPSRPQPGSPSPCSPEPPRRCRSLPGSTHRSPRCSRPSHRRPHTPSCSLTKVQKAPTDGRNILSLFQRAPFGFCFQTGELGASTSLLVPPIKAAVEQPKHHDKTEQRSVSKTKKAHNSLSNISHDKDKGRLHFMFGSKWTIFWLNTFGVITGK